MEVQSLSGRAMRQAFLKQVEALWPVAMGSVTEVRKTCSSKGCKACASGRKHPSLFYTFRVDGKSHCCYVRPEFAGELRQAIENGRKLERIISRLGRALLEDLRARRP
jgi:hypothetical protein